ncbi:MAG: hypothetical protein ABIO70_28220 [Pseudomonadota bacterium]
MPHEDFDVPRASALIPFAGLVLMGAGLAQLVTGVQLLDLIMPWWLKPVPVLMLALGVATAGAGGMVVRTRFWAVLAGLGLAAAQLLACLVWFVYAAFHGFFSAMPLVTMLASFVALVLAPLAIGPTRRLSRARAELLEDL